MLPACCLTRKTEQLQTGFCQQRRYRIFLKKPCPHPYQRIFTCLEYSCQFSFGNPFSWYHKFRLLWSFHLFSDLVQLPFTLLRSNYICSLFLPNTGPAKESFCTLLLHSFFSARIFPWLQCLLTQAILEALLFPVLHLSHCSTVLALDSQVTKVKSLHFFFVSVFPTLIWR